MTTKQESRLFPKPKKSSFGLNKHYHGKVVVNSWTQNQRQQKQRPGTSLEQQRMYLKSVFQEDDDPDENNVYSAGSTLRTAYDPKANINASYNSTITMSQSYNPMEHKYARVLDLQLNAKSK